MEMCQSCGMPMNKDPQSGGTNTDGDNNKNISNIGESIRRKNLPMSGTAWQ